MPFKKIMRHLGILLAAAFNSFGATAYAQEQGDGRLLLVEALVDNEIFDSENASLYVQSLDDNSVEEIMTSFGFVKVNPNGLGSSPWTYDVSRGELLGRSGPAEWLARPSK